MLLPDKLTPCTAQEKLAAFAVAWSALFNEEPTKARVCVLAAHWALETGRGKFCHNWNDGNYKHVDGDGRDWCFFRCNEVINGKVVWFDPPDPACCFRAYSTIEAGTIDYVASLAKRFKLAWQAVLDGDPAAFAHLLKVQHYYTAPEKAYASGVVSLWNEYMKLDMPPADLTDDQKANILGLVALTARDALD